MKDVLLAVLVLSCGALVALIARERRRLRSDAQARSPRRILFPFAGRALSQPVLDAALRLARAERATLVPAYLARVPLHLPLTAPLPLECTAAMPLLEAIEQRAAACGVPVDARIERGRDRRHALRSLLAHEPFDRMIVAADAHGTDGFDAADIAWVLDHAAGEILVLRPARDRRVVAEPTPHAHRREAGQQGRPGLRRRVTAWTTAASTTMPATIPTRPAPAIKPPPSAAPASGSSAQHRAITSAPAPSSFSGTLMRSAPR
jgi:hypothetical protein